MNTPGQTFSTRRLLFAYDLPLVLQWLREGKSYRDARAALARNGLHVARGTLYTDVCQYRYLLQDAVAGEVERQVQEREQATQRREAAALAAQHAAKRAAQEACAACRRAEQAQEAAERAVEHARRRARNAIGAAKRIKRRVESKKRLEADFER